MSLKNTRATKSKGPFKKCLRGRHLCHVVVVLGNVVLIHIHPYSSAGTQPYWVCDPSDLTIGRCQRVTLSFRGSRLVDSLIFSRHHIS